jgi:hypothetical protein
MSISLPSLLDLSYSLSCGRKRRNEWESLAEMAPRKNPGSKRTQSDCSYDDPIVAADMAEMQLLDGSLRTQSLMPRAPDAENAFLRLLSADARLGKPSQVCSLEGTDFDWLFAHDEMPVAAQGPFDVLCPVKSNGKGNKSADETFARLLGATNDIPEDNDELAPPEVMKDESDESAHQGTEEEPEVATQKEGYPATDDNIKELAIHRLLSMVYESATCATDTEDASTAHSTDCEWDSDTSDFAREVASAALFEAENAEKDELDGAVKLASAVETKCCL